MSTCHVQLGGGAGCKSHYIISLVILFLTTGWSVGLIEYVGSQRRRKSGVYLEGNATFVWPCLEVNMWRHPMGFYVHCAEELWVKMTCTSCVMNKSDKAVVFGGRFFLHPTTPQVTKWLFMLLHHPHGDSTYRSIMVLYSPHCILYTLTWNLQQNKNNMYDL